MTRSVSDLGNNSFLRGVTVFGLVTAVPTIIHNLGLHSLFIFHGVVCAFAAVFVWAMVPETRGKTLTQLCSIYQ